MDNLLKILIINHLHRNSIITILIIMNLFKIILLLRSIRIRILNKIMIIIIKNMIIMILKDTMIQLIFHQIRYLIHPIKGKVIPLSLIHQRLIIITTIIKLAGVSKPSSSHMRIFKKSVTPQARRNSTVRALSIIHYR